MIAIEVWMEKLQNPKVMKHPGGEIRNGKLTYFNPKGGKTNEVGRRTI